MIRAFSLHREDHSSFLRARAEQRCIRQRFGRADVEHSNCALPPLVKVHVQVANATFGNI